MNTHRKLLAAIVGLTVLFVYRRFGIDLSGTEAFLIEIIASVATAVAVHFFPECKDLREKP